MIGTLWLVVYARSSTRAGALAVAVLAVYAWSLLSMLTTLVGTTLLSFRLQPTLTVLLTAAGAFGFIEATQAHRGPVPHPRRGGSSRPARRSARSARMTFSPGHPRHPPARHRRRLHRHRRLRPARRPPAARRRAVLRRDRRQDPRGHRSTRQPDRGDDRRLQVPGLLPVLGFPGPDLALRQPARPVRRALEGHRELGDAHHARRARRRVGRAAVGAADRLRDAARRQRHLHVAAGVRRLPEPTERPALPGDARFGPVRRPGWSVSDIGPFVVAIRSH